MAVESTFVYDESYQAAADLSSLQFYIVNSTGEGVCNLCVTATTGTGTNSPVGVLQNDPTSGHAAIVRKLGRTKVVAGAAIAYGVLLSSTTAGTAITSATTGAYAWGRCVSASTAAGQVITAEVFQAGFCLVGGS